MAGKHRAGDWRTKPRPFSDRPQLRRDGRELLCRGDLCAAEPRRRLRVRISGGHGPGHAGDWRRAWRRAGNHSGWSYRLCRAAWRHRSTGHIHRNVALQSRTGERNGGTGARTSRKRIPFQRVRQGLQENPARIMRVLNVTQSYAPFFEFGGPPAKVRALAEGLARKGHSVTVLTADWGLDRRLELLKEGPAMPGPFGRK